MIQLIKEKIIEFVQQHAWDRSPLKTKTLYDFRIRVATQEEKQARANSYLNNRTVEQIIFIREEYQRLWWDIETLPEIYEQVNAMTQYQKTQVRQILGITERRKK